MPLIPLTIDDTLYLQLEEAASHKKVSVLDYIKDRLKSPEGWIVFRDVSPGEGLPIPPAATMIPPRAPTADEIEVAIAAYRPTFQPAAALDEEYQCGFTLSHLINARKKLLEISIFLGHPLAEIPTQKRSTCKDAQWQAQRILAELTWLSKSLEEDAYQVVDASQAVAKADVAEDFDPFWMVVRDQGDGHAVSATQRHPAMFLAEHEAERLCSKERKPFLIFQAVARCEAGETPINWQLAKGHQP